MSVSKQIGDLTEVWLNMSTEGNYSDAAIVRDAIDSIESFSVRLKYSGWMPSKVKQPKEYGEYLVTCKDISTPQIRVYEETWDSIDEVIAWMPLPERFNIL